ncbi:hypothetical protein [Streptomyces sp. NPDC004266]|uniref:hypothetical protein n=1 Tax=Streptomyces sp. NPDC004266 TaxID=3364693 RepID=UPI0036B6D0DC
MTARVVGVEFQGGWRYAATCPCGGQYACRDADWAFIVAITVAHTWLEQGAR